MSGPRLMALALALFAWAEKGLEMASDKLAAELYELRTKKIDEELAHMRAMNVIEADLAAKAAESDRAARVQARLQELLK